MNVERQTADLVRGLLRLQPKQETGMRVVVNHHDDRNGPIIENLKATTIDEALIEIATVVIPDNSGDYPIQKYSDLRKPDPRVLVIDTHHEPKWGMGIEEIILYDGHDTYDFDLEEYQRRIEAVIADERTKEDESRERSEYDRLQAKFGS